MKKFLMLLLIIGGIIITLFTYNATSFYDYTPASKIDLSYLNEDNLTEEDYELILSQTGLTKAGLELIDFNDLEKFQDQYLNPFEVKTTDIDITVEELNVLDGKVTAPSYIVPLEAGDIIISLSNHTMGFLHGHSAIMINDHEMLGINNLFSTSEISSYIGMTKFSSFIILRCKEDLDFESYFKENLKDLTNKPYNVFASKNAKEYKGGICSYLVWYPYHELGVDLDSDAGYFVTPRDILESPKLEVLQIYGLSKESLETFKEK